MSATPLAVPQEIHDAPDTVLSSGEFPVALRWRGLEPYSQSFDAMRAFTDARTPDTPDEIWLVEHPPVFTLGLAGDPAHLLLAESGIPLLKVDRGGQITYHGPGQIVGYPILDLREWKRDVVAYVRAVEQAIIDAIAAFGISGGRVEGATGVWVDGGKVAAIGVHISRWVTSHGFALNLDTDLAYFHYIVPCGLTKPVTSMRELGSDASRPAVVEALTQAFARCFGYDAMRAGNAWEAGRTAACARP